MKHIMIPVFLALVLIGTSPALAQTPATDKQAEDAIKQSMQQVRALMKQTQEAISNAHGQTKNDAVKQSLMQAHQALQDPHQTVLQSIKTAADIISNMPQEHMESHMQAAMYDVNLAIKNMQQEMSNNANPGGKP